MDAWAAVAILGFVTLQRLVELRLADRNSSRLLGDGAVELGRGHYPLHRRAPLLLARGLVVVGAGPADRHPAARPLRRSCSSAGSG